MKNKKITAILTILFLSLSLCGCSGKVDVSQESGSEIETSEEKEEETETIKESESTEEEAEKEETTTKEKETAKESESKTEESKEEKKETETKESKTSESSKQSTPKQEETKQAETTTAPHTHSYSNSVIIENATCNKDGSKQLSCSCGDSRTEIIPATGQHTWQPQYEIIEYPKIEEWQQIQIGTSGDVYICNYCGEQSSSSEANVNHCASYIGIDNNHARATYTIRDGGPIYESKLIVIQEAKTENVLTGYICTTCGISQK